MKYCHIIRHGDMSNKSMIYIVTLAAYGLPAVDCPFTVTLTRCSPTDRGTNSALNIPSPVRSTCAGTDCPDGPKF